MKRDEPEKILDDHAKWLAGDGGKKACLYGADLRGADLSGLDLRWVDLQGVKNLYLLPVQDPRGYPWPFAVKCEDGEWRIRAGCRFFTIAEARKHWGPSYRRERRTGDMYLAAIDWLERVIAEDAAIAKRLRAAAPAPMKRYSEYVPPV